MRPQDIVEQFNACINGQDLDGLASFMADDHEFTDTAGNTERGKAHCLSLWRGFFEQFADYRNTFTSLTARDDEVVVVGCSTCSNQLLDGPALWTARIRDGKVTRWCVYTDTDENRRALKIL